MADRLLILGNFMMDEGRRGGGLMCGRMGDYELWWDRPQP